MALCSSPFSTRISTNRLSQQRCLRRHCSYGILCERCPLERIQHGYCSLVAQLVKESTCSAGDLGSVPGLGRSPGEGKGYPLQYSGLENSMDCIIHGIAKSQTRLNNLHFYYFNFYYKTPLYNKTACQTRNKIGSRF